MSKILYRNITIQNPFEDSFVSDMLVEDEKISLIVREIDISIADEVIDASNKMIFCGFIDRHTHGGYGCNFNTCDEKELQNYLVNARNHGVVAVLPTLMTDSIENINRQISLLKNIESKGAKIIGVHLEGPFINPLKKGIHPSEYIFLPTIENLDMFDTSFIKVLTYAPELDENNEFLNELKARNIIPSAGHTDATYAQAENFARSGIKQVTHLFNAMRPIHHREAGLITKALNDDDFAVEIIADLQHVSRPVLDMLLKVKPKEKILFISDSLPISYSEKKEDIFGGQAIFYDGEKACSKNGTLAGSTLFLDDIYKRVSEFVSFRDFIGFASKNIAESLNLKGFDVVKAGMNISDTVICDKNLL